MNTTTSSTQAAAPRPVTETPLRSVRANIVQSIRAFRVPDLQEAAQGLGHHFLYANLAAAQSKQDVLDLIGQQFMLTINQGKKLSATSSLVGLSRA